MTEDEYLDWIRQEMIRAEVRVAKLEALFESDDPVNIMTGLSEVSGPGIRLL